MPEYKEVKRGDKLLREKSGAVRSSGDGKGRFDLLSCHALIRLAKHYENGAKKYGEDNWRKGLSMRRYADSAIRHMVKYLGGDREEDHLAAAAWNVFCMIDHEEMIERGLLDPKFNDMRRGCDFLPGEFDPKPRKKKSKGQRNERKASSKRKAH